VNGILLDSSGLSRAEKRAALLQRQGGQCAICKADSPRCADHDHATGLLRGMLCPACNHREGRHSSGLLAVDDPAVGAYLSALPAAGLGWMWDLPDWWTPADTRAATAAGITVLEYAARNRCRVRGGVTVDQAIDALQGVELPPLEAL
jgi:hypothetical protein